MTANESDPGDRLPPVPDGWRELDDTLADGAAPAEVPDQAKPWLGEQRYVHGLLRALHTADAQARESRIERVLAAIDAEADAGDDADADAGAMARPSRWRQLAFAAAAVLLALLGVWASLPASLPTAAAAVERAVAELARDVDRRYVCRVEIGEDSARPIEHTFTLVARSGLRFRIDGRLGFAGAPFGEFRIGCDGEELWVVSANGMFRRAAPLAERERLMTGLAELLDPGYLDVHDLVRKLPESFDLQVVGREAGIDGRELLRIVASQRGAVAPRFEHAELWCDEASGMVVRVVVDGLRRRGPVRRLQIDYQGEEPPGLVEYRRPW